MNNTKTVVSPELEEDSFFVQNVTPGHHFVSDMGIYFEPYEVKDLLSEDPALLKKSRDIRRSLALGNLQKISRDEADQLMEMEIAMLQQEQRKEAAQRESSVINVDGKQIVADTFDAARAGGGDKSGLVSTAGFATDHSSYAQAFNNLRTAYADQGKILTAREFGQMTQDNPDIVRNYMNRTSTGSWSGDPGRGKATYAVPSYGDGDNRAPAQASMTNFNRDQRLAGIDHTNLVIDSNESYAEEILIGDDDEMDAYEEESKKGSVKRKR